MGYEWEVEVLDGEEWVTVERFDGSPWKALRTLSKARRDNQGVNTFRLVWRP